MHAMQYPEKSKIAQNLNENKPTVAHRMQVPCNEKKNVPQVVNALSHTLLLLGCTVKPVHCLPLVNTCCGSA